MNPLHSAHVDRLITKHQDFHMRRITNASDAIHDRDYVTLRQLKNGIDEAKRAVGGRSAAPASASSVPATNFAWGENVLPSGVASVTPDMSLGVFQVVLASVPNVLFNAPINPAGVGHPLHIIFIQDATGGRTITFDTASYTGSQEIIPYGRGDTYTSCAWYLSSSGKWTFLQFHTGIPIV